MSYINILEKIDLVKLKQKRTRIFISLILLGIIFISLFLFWLRYSMTAYNIQNKSLDFIVENSTVFLTSIYKTSENETVLKNIIKEFEPNKYIKKIALYDPKGQLQESSKQANLTESSFYKGHIITKIIPLNEADKKSLYIEMTIDTINSFKNIKILYIQAVILFFITIICSATLGFFIPSVISYFVYKKRIKSN